MAFRVAIIGTGHVAHLHANAYRASGKAEIVAVADVNDEVRAAFQKEYGIPNTYGDYRAMLDSECPDVVSVCVWPHLHPEMTIRAAGTHGVKGILCEKPLALTLPAMNEMIAACRQRGIALGVGHQLRHQAHVRAARELINSGTFGAVRRVWAVCGSGDLMSNTIHTIDLVHFFCDDRQVTRVFAQADPGDGAYRFGHPVERTSVAYALIPEDGGIPDVRICVESANCWSQGYHYITIECADGTIEINKPGSPPVVAKGWRSAEKELGELQEEPDPSTLAVRDLFDAVERHREPVSNGITGYKAVEFILAMYQSALHRSIVELPLPADTPDPLRHFFNWDGVIRGGRGTAFSTTGAVTTTGKIS